MKNDRQSGIDWLIEQLPDDYKMSLPYELVEKAKEIEKENMEFFFRGGMSLVEGRLWKPTGLFDEFYDKTFKNNEQR